MRPDLNRPPSRRLCLEARGKAERVVKPTRGASWLIPFQLAASLCRHVRMHKLRQPDRDGLADSHPALPFVWRRRMADRLGGDSVNDPHPAATRRECWPAAVLRGGRPRPTPRSPRRLVPFARRRLPWRHRPVRALRPAFALHDGKAADLMPGHLVQSLVEAMVGTDGHRVARVDVADGGRIRVLALGHDPHCDVAVVTSPTSMSPSTTGREQTSSDPMSRATSVTDDSGRRWSGSRS